MKSSLKNMVIVLASVSAITAAVVGYVYKITKDPIAKTKENKLNTALQDVLPIFDSLSDPIEFKVYPEDAENIKVYVAKEGNEVVGYAVESYTTNGYSGMIKILVGFDADFTINKIAVISHAETPGLGAKITDNIDPFVVQFQGKNPQNFKLSLRSDGGNVDAITASTITSKAYSDAVSRAYEGVKTKYASKK